MFAIAVSWVRVCEILPRIFLTRVSPEVWTAPRVLTLRPRASLYCFTSFLKTVESCHFIQIWKVMGLGSRCHLVEVYRQVPYTKLGLYSSGETFLTEKPLHRRDGESLRTWKVSRSRRPVSAGWLVVCRGRQGMLGRGGGPLFQLAGSLFPSLIGYQEDTFPESLMLWQFSEGWFITTWPFLLLNNSSSLFIMFHLEH